MTRQMTSQTSSATRRAACDKHLCLPDLFNVGESPRSAVRSNSLIYRKCGWSGGCTISLFLVNAGGAAAGIRHPRSQAHHIRSVLQHLRLCLGSNGMPRPGSDVEAGMATRMTNVRMLSVLFCCWLRRWSISQYGSYLGGPIIVDRRDIEANAANSGKARLDFFLDSRHRVADVVHIVVRMKTQVDG